MLDENPVELWRVFEWKRKDIAHEAETNLSTFFGKHLESLKISSI